MRILAELYVNLGAPVGIALVVLSIHPDTSGWLLLVGCWLIMTSAVVAERMGI